MAATDDHAPAWRDAPSTLREYLSADVLEDQVGATAIGELTYRGDQILPPVVYRGVCPFGGGLRQLLIGPCRGDHACSGQLGDLQRRAADAAANRVHDH